MKHFKKTFEKKCARSVDMCAVCCAGADVDKSVARLVAFVALHCESVHCTGIHM